MADTSPHAESTDPTMRADVPAHLTSGHGITCDPGCGCRGNAVPSTTELLDQVAALRLWKGEALEVMAAYQDLARRVVPGGAGIGRRWSDLLAEHVETLTAERDAAQDRIARALAVLNGAPIPMGEVRARHAAAILRGDRG